MNEPRPSRRSTPPDIIAAYKTLDAWPPRCSCDKPAVATGRSREDCDDPVFVCTDCLVKLAPELKKRKGFDNAKKTLEGLGKLLSEPGEQAPNEVESEYAWSIGAFPPIELLRVVVDAWQGDEISIEARRQEDGLWSIEIQCSGTEFSIPEELLGERETLPTAQDVLQMAESLEAGDSLWDIEESNPDTEVFASSKLYPEVAKHLQAQSEERRRRRESDDDSDEDEDCAR